MKWIKVKNKSPPIKTRLIVWRYAKDSYTIAYYIDGYWLSISKWYLSVSPNDEWMILPEKNK